MKKLVTAMAVLLTSASGFAGVGSSGGGKTIVCRDSANQIKSVESLDLWEAREILGLMIPPSSKSVEEQVDDAAHSLKNVVYYDVGIGTIDQNGKSVSYRGADALEYEIKQTARYFTNPSSSVRRLRGSTLTPIDDSLEDAYPNGCLPEQAIIYHDDSSGQSTIIVNQDLIDRLDDQNKAALFVHESLYRALRKLGGEANSLRTRRAVGLAFSGRQFNAVSSFIPNDFVACGTDNPNDSYSFIVLYPEPNARPDSGAFVIKPIVLGGVFLTDFNSSRSSRIFKSNTIDEFVNSVFVPDLNLKPETTSGEGLRSDGQIIDREVSAWFHISTFKGSQSIALSIDRVSASWPASQAPTFLRCVRGDKSLMFP